MMSWQLLPECDADAAEGLNRTRAVEVHAGTQGSRHALVEFVLPQAGDAFAALEQGRITLADFASLTTDLVGRLGECDELLELRKLSAELKKLNKRLFEANTAALAAMEAKAAAVRDQPERVLETVTALREAQALVVDVRVAESELARRQAEVRARLSQRIDASIAAALPAIVRERIAELRAKRQGAYQRLQNAASGPLGELVTTDLEMRRWQLLNSETTPALPVLARLLGEPEPQERSPADDAVDPELIDNNNEDSEPCPPQPQPPPRSRPRKQSTS